MCVDIECTGLAEPRVTFSSATMAGSMPAMAPLREGSRCERPDRSAVSASYETLTALPSGCTRPATRQSRPKWPERRALTVVGCGARTGTGALAIVIGRL
jgi:hypothetical protein